MSPAAVSIRGAEGNAPVVTAVPGTAPGPVRLRPQETPGRAWARPLWIIAVCCLLVVARLGRDALIPLGLALLAAFILSGAVERLRRIHLPRAVSAAALLMLLGGGLVGTAEMVATPAQQWMLNAPRALRIIEHKVRPAQSMLRRLDDLAKRATALANPGVEASTDAPAPGSALVTPLDVFAFTGVAAFNIVTVLAFAFLLLSAGPPTIARLTCVLAGEAHAAQVLQVINAIRGEVGRYYATLLLINVCYGAVVGALMWLLGMPNPALWGVLAAVLNFVPYIGPAATLAILTVVSLVTFDGVTHTLLVGASYVALATVEGHIIEPVFLGRRLNLNPILVLLAVWIGGWLWGVAGVLLALPLLLALKVATRTAPTRRANALSRL
jgi:predicted PurR-regulated permease PerM